MKQFFHKIFVWFLMVQKRLFKKTSFLIVFALVFLIVFGMRFTANQKSGLITIALAQEKQNDFAEQIINQLLEVRSIYFIDCKSPQDARILVEQKKADAAWIFDADFEEHIEQAGKAGAVRPVVSILQGQDTVLLALVREILFSKIYPYFSYSAYKNYIKQKIPSANDNDIKIQFQRFNQMPHLFTQKTFGPTNVQNNFRSFYLISPLRGMLALWLFMCGFAATLYFIQDKERNSFVWVSSRSSLRFFLAMVLIPLCDCAVILLIALKAGGIMLSFGIELPAVVMLIISIALFCNLLRLLTINKNIFCAATTIILLTMMVVCPIFLKVNSFRPLQFSFPIFYYLNSIYSKSFMIQFAIYTGILFVLNIIATKISSICKL